MSPALDPRPVLKPASLYIGDNGRLFCGKAPCAGMSALYTARDISGQPVERITRKMILESGYDVDSFTCESCGRGVTE
jgi:hypothetical protein